MYHNYERTGWSIKLKLNELSVPFTRNSETSCIHI